MNNNNNTNNFAFIVNDIVKACKKRNLLINEKNINLYCEKNDINNIMKDFIINFFSVNDKDVSYTTVKERNDEIDKILKKMEENENHFDKQIKEINKNVEKNEVEIKNLGNNGKIYEIKISSIGEKLEENSNKIKIALNKNFDNIMIHNGAINGLQKKFIELQQKVVEQEIEFKNVKDIFRKELENKNIKEKSDNICHFYSKGRCNNGDKCRFVHA